jgi:hypothetical protein
MQSKTIITDIPEPLIHTTIVPYGQNYVLVPYKDIENKILDLSTITTKYSILPKGYHKLGTERKNELIHASFCGYKKGCKICDTFWHRHYSKFS